jgi:hypothetical protein
MPGRVCDSPAGHLAYNSLVTVQYRQCLPQERYVDYIKLGVHIWVSVLIMGTMWRLVSYHLMASSNGSLVELGKAMATQY